MNCTVTLTINGKDREFTVNSEPSTLIDESIVNALKNNKELLKELVDDLKEKLNTQDKITPLKIGDLIGKEGIVANCTLNYLRESPEYCYLNFPDGNANILLVDNLTIGGKSAVSQRVIKTNAKGETEEIYIVKNDPKDLTRFSNYLKEKNTIEAGAKITEESTYYSELNEILNLRKKGRGGNKNLSNIEDVLLDYIGNKGAYGRYFLENGKSAIQVLEKFIRNLKNYNTPLEYDDQFITSLNYNKYYKGDGKIWASYDTFYELFKQYYPAILENLGVKKGSFSEKIEKEKAINSILSTIRDAEEANNTQELLKDCSNGHEVLIRYALRTEPEFTYAYEGQSKKGITLKQEYIPISDKYGITFDTIQNMPEEQYRGYTVYGSNGEFFISRGTLTESSLSKKYETSDEAKLAIDSTINNQPLIKNSLVEFKFRETYDDNGTKKYIESFPEKIQSRTIFLKGQIIESLNIPIDRDTQIISSEVPFISNKDIKLKDFYNLIDEYPLEPETKDYIKEKINTPEKAVLFVFKINEELGTQPRKNDEVIQQIVDTIDNAKSNYYYVENKYYTGPKGWSYKLIKIDKNKLTEAKQKPNQPIRMWLDAISVALQNQFNVPVHIVSANEVEAMNGVADPNTDKAFIYNNEVYVNSSIATTNDLLHEHVHLILGILKSNPELRKNHEGLINLVANTEEGKREISRISERYNGLSEMDLREEAFANLFSNYIRGEVDIETDKVFNASEKELEKITKTIFNNDIYDIKSFYSGGLISIFNKFNKEVSKYMQSNEDIDFGNTQNSRKISNWISEKINANEITEEC